jgi:hypothetical protein
MKKVYLALLCVAGLTLATACGGEKKQAGASADAPLSAEEGLELAQKASEAMSGVEKCAQTLEKGWSIQLKQLEPDFAFAEVTEGWDKFEGNGVNSAAAVYQKKDGSAISQEEFRAWAEKLFALTKSLSKDGKNIHGYDGISHLTEEQANAEVSLDDCLKDNSFPAWSFRTDKGIQRCYATHETSREPHKVIVRFAPGLAGNLD